MAVEHGCFLELAKVSIEKSGEQWTRNAISRAYYSMYHSSMRIVKGRVPTRDKHGERIQGGVHLRFYSYLCSGDAAEEHQLDVMMVKKLGMKLKSQHFHRVKADYALSEKINRITALSCIRDAEEADSLILKLIAPAFVQEPE